MTMTDIGGVRVARSNTEWGPIFAGAVLATALGLVLLTFGAALGLSVTSAYDNGDQSPMALAIAAGISFAGIGGAATAAYNSPDSVSASVAHEVTQQVDQAANDEQAQNAPAAS